MKNIAALVSLALVALSANADVCDYKEYAQYKDEASTTEGQRSMSIRFCYMTQMLRLASETGHTRNASRCSSEIDKIHTALKSRNARPPDCVALVPERAAQAMCAVRAEEDYPRLAKSKQGRVTLVDDYCKASAVSGEMSRNIRSLNPDQLQELMHCSAVQGAILKAAVGTKWVLPSCKQ